MSAVNENSCLNETWLFDLWKCFFLGDSTCKMLGGTFADPTLSFTSIYDGSMISVILSAITGVYIAVTRPVSLSNTCFTFFSVRLRMSAVAELAYTLSGFCACFLKKALRRVFVSTKCSRIVCRKEALFFCWAIFSLASTKFS